MKIDELEWDSNFFGFKVYKIILSSQLEFSIDVVYQLFNNNARLIYVFLEEGYIKEEILEKLNGILVDTKVIYSKRLNNHNSMKTNCIIEYKSAVLDEKLLKLTFQSGEESRFKKDKLVPEDSFERLYTLWIEKSIKNISKEKVFIYQLDDEIIGFVTVEIKNNYGQIGLIAVEHSYRGKGIGKELLTAAESFLVSKKIYELRIPTQKTNYRACNFYERCNFKAFSQTNIYHLHNIN